MYGVFPSSCNYSESAQRFQFRWISAGDSGEVVTSFMQVTTYVTRGFATLGPLWLQPPFTGGYILSKKLILLTDQHWADVRPYTSFYNLAESCVFSKQSPPLIFLTKFVKNLAPFFPKLLGQFAEFLQHL